MSSLFPSQVTMESSLRLEGQPKCNAQWWCKNDSTLWLGGAKVVATNPPCEGWTELFILLMTSKLNKRTKCILVLKWVCQTTSTTPISSHVKTEITWGIWDKILEEHIPNSLIIDLYYDKHVGFISHLMCLLFFSLIWKLWNGACKLTNIPYYTDTQCHSLIMILQLPFLH